MGRQIYKTIVIIFEIISHHTPGGNLQEELLNIGEGAETKAAFSHSYACVCISRAAAIFLHLFLLPHSILVQMGGCIKDALSLTL